MGFAFNFGCCCQEGCRVCDDTADPPASQTVTIADFVFTGTPFDGCDASQINGAWVLTVGGGPGFYTALGKPYSCLHFAQGRFTLPDLCTGGLDAVDTLVIQSAVAYHSPADITTVWLRIYIAAAVGTPSYLLSTRVEGDFIDVAGRITCCGYSHEFDVLPAPATATLDIAC